MFDKFKDFLRKKHLINDILYISDLIYDDESLPNYIPRNDDGTPDLTEFDKLYGVVVEKARVYRLKEMPPKGDEIQGFIPQYFLCSDGLVFMFETLNDAKVGRNVFKRCGLPVKKDLLRVYAQKFPSAA